MSQSLGHYFRFSIIVFLIVVLICGAFFFGYFRGYHDRSRIATGFHLELEEGYLDQLAQQRIELLRESLKLSILGEARNYRDLQAHPVSNFLNEVSAAHVDDLSSSLRVADKITTGLKTPALTKEIKKEEQAPTPATASTSAVE